MEGAGSARPEVWTPSLPHRAAQSAEPESRDRESQPQPERELRGRRQSLEARRGGGGGCVGGRGSRRPSATYPSGAHRAERDQNGLSPSPSPSRSPTRAGAGRAVVLSVRPPPPLPPRGSAPPAGPEGGGAPAAPPSSSRPPLPPPSCLHPGYLAALAVRGRGRRLWEHAPEGLAGTPGSGIPVPTASGEE